LAGRCSFLVYDPFGVNDMEPRDLSDHVPYRAGRGIEEVARKLDMDPDDLIKLSSNENVLGPSPAAVRVLRENASRAGIYPKAAHTDLTQRLAEVWNVTPEQVWLGNGADGAIDCLSRAMLRPGDRVLVPDPGFAYYGMSARYHHGQVDTYPVERGADAFRQTPGTILSSYLDHRMIYINTPHNPTGSEFSIDDVRRLAEETGTDTLTVVDEAYAEFSEAEPAVELLDERDDVAVLRTFSKAYGLAGLRIGYALVPAGWGEAYSRINTPFETGELAPRAALAALDDREHLEKTRAMVREAREQLYEELDANTWRSGGNFVLVEVGDAERVTDGAKREGVLIRDCTSFGLPDCVRVTCGTTEMIDRAVAVLNKLTE